MNTLLVVFLMLASAGAPACQGLDDIARLGEGRSFRVSSADKDWKHGNVDFRPIRPGETLTLADLKGPGTIRRLWLTILPSEPGYSRLMSLRIYWDGEKSPSVQCPLGDFFAVGHGLEADVNSLPVRVSADGKARSCNWRMPFRKSARITVTNDGALATWCFYYQVDGEYERVSPDAPYFHAMYRQEFPCHAGSNYVVANIKGRGNYVGSVVSTRSTSDGWWGEGNDFFFIDGDKTPTLKGTGFEDAFGQAWGLRTSDGPYQGCTLFEGGFVGARASCYRWHVPDPIRFTRGLRVEFQHMGVGPTPGGGEKNNVERADEFSSVGFWYQTGEHAAYPPLPKGYDRLPFDYRNFVEAEKTRVTPPLTGTLHVEKMNGLHGDAELEWTGGKEGSEIGFPFTAPAAGEFQVMVLISKADTGGKGLFLIDGKPLSEPLSFKAGDFEMHQERPLEFTHLAAGPHVLTLRCLETRSEGEKPTWFAIDGYIVQPKRPNRL